VYSNKAYPYPQIVTGEQWHVMETTDTDPQPRTDNLNKQMYVPMDRECTECGINHSRMIRRHELGHAKWSPKTMGKLLRGTRTEAIHAMEEVRINYLLGRFAKLHMNEWTQCEEDVRRTVVKMMYESSITDIILYGLASYSTDLTEYGGVGSSKQYNTVLDILHTNSEDLSMLRKTELEYAVRIIRNFVNKMTDHRYGQRPSYKKTQKLAEQLSVILNEFIDKPNPDDVKATPEELNSKSGDDTESSSSSAEVKAQGSEDLEKRMRRNLIEEMQYESTSGVGRWGEMEIINAPLSVNLQSRLKNGRAYRPNDYGYNPKYINRYCIDKKIFKQKQNVKGGTILIDASGSMRFNSQDILEIMQMLPAVNIAMYNGLGNTGHLRIIAKNGKRCTDDYLNKHTGGGNIVDGPALHWLATMPPRRIWVSDMKVFGAGDNSSGYNLLKECFDVCTKNRIINLKDIDEVKEHALKLNRVL
jgi:hypothetical protein